LEPVYIAVAFDALRLKIRDESLVQHKAVYLALGTTASGAKDILGFWIAQTEGTAFWQRVRTELQGRGVRDILIAVIDGRVITSSYTNFLTVPRAPFVSCRAPTVNYQLTASHCQLSLGRHSTDT
jgi:hypothetical protein